MAQLKRRLAAILAADVPGYSRLMGAEEEGSIDALNTSRAQFRAGVRSHAGRIVDITGQRPQITMPTLYWKTFTAVRAAQRSHHHTTVSHLVRQKQQSELRPTTRASESIRQEKMHVAPRALRPGRFARAESGRFAGECIRRGPLRPHLPGPASPHGWATQDRCRGPWGPRSLCPSPTVR